MKTINLIKIAALILVGISLNLQVRAEGDKYSRNARPVLTQFSNYIKLSGEDIKNMQLLLSQTDAVHVTWNNHELKFALDGKMVPVYSIRFEAADEGLVEDWMLEPDYLNEESEGEIESWMLNPDYLDADHQPLEDWMFNSVRPSEIENNNPLEPWMFESNYLSK